MIKLCYFSLDQWEIRIHLLWGKCFNIPHHCDPYLNQTKLNGLLPLPIDGVIVEFLSRLLARSDQKRHLAQEQTRVLFYIWALSLNGVRSTITFQAPHYRQQQQLRRTNYLCIMSPWKIFKGLKSPKLITLKRFIERSCLQCHIASSGWVHRPCEGAQQTGVCGRLHVEPGLYESGTGGHGRALLCARDPLVVIETGGWKLCCEYIMSINWSLLRNKLTLTYQ